jgi:putative phage-type endonuclease
MAREHIAQKSEAWYAVRANMLTASDCAAALDIKPFESFKGSPRDELFKKKVWPSPWKGNRFTAHGTFWEPTVSRLISEFLGEEVLECGLLQHQEYPWLGASPDGMLAQSGRLIEIKCPLKRSFGNGASIPSHYYPQIQIQMCVSDVEETLFCQYTPAHLNHGKHVLAMVAVQRDRQWFDRVLPLLEAFHNDVVAARQILPQLRGPPPPPPQLLRRCLIVDDLYDD